jgi:hypothetical protein
VTAPGGQTGLHNRTWLGVGYGLAVFSAGLLVFGVQPLVAKFVVPWFGGASDVWTTCMLFFQVLLLCGYLYGHLSASLLSPRGQAVLHVMVLLAAAVTLPIRPAQVWAEGNHPILGVLLTLAGSVGLPYFALSSSSPLLQSWFGRTAGLGLPYRLYALSNAGSLLAIIGYPLVMEPWLSRRFQAQLWSLGMGLLVALEVLLAVAFWRHRSVAPHREDHEDKADDKAPADPSPAEPGLRDVLLWIALPAGASVVLLATTNKICQDVAAIPMLWMPPLCLYLLSFVVCFHHERWYVRPVFLAVFMAAIVGAVLVDKAHRNLSVYVEIVVYLVTLAACCMVCHGELYRLRPPARRLTHFYLMIALGGCCGGLLVAVVAPLVFRSYVELNLGLAACGMFVLLADKNPSPGLRRRRWIYAVAILGACALTVTGARGGTAYNRVIDSRRNFYGVITIWEQDSDDPALHRYVLEHGTTIHGLQFLRDDKRMDPTAYYGRRSGVGLALGQLATSPRLRIGVVGLGVGTIAAYGRQGDTIRFYEINPAVRDVAQSYFTYLSACPARVELVMGDARLSLEREEDQAYDLLVLDAFSSDSVPTHLLTTQAFQTYLRHLKRDGVLAVHASAVYLNLRPVVMKLAEHFGLRGVYIYDGGNAAQGTMPSTWILLGHPGVIVDATPIRQAAGPPPKSLERVALWTDDYVNPLQILRY